MFVNVIRSYRDTVAVCDKELIGKKFEEGIFQLNVKESFYKGEEKSRDEIIKLMTSLAAEDATFNIVGKKSVATALEAGVIEEGSIGHVQGIPFALILM